MQYAQFSAFNVNLNHINVIDMYQIIQTPLRY